MADTGLFRRAYDATWGRAFAAVYDLGMARTEEAGLRQRRAELVAQARGRTLELGGGTGLNLPHYTDAVERLVLSEPFGPMAAKLRKRAASLNLDAEVVEAPAEKLPFPNDSFDTVICTLVLCTVDDLEGSITEIGRVLRPDGQFLFLEHVRSDDPARARWQDRLHGPWFAFGHGCHCNRDTEAALASSALQIQDFSHDKLPKSPPITRPMIVGSAGLSG